MHTLEKKVKHGNIFLLYLNHLSDEKPIICHLKKMFLPVEKR